MDVDNTELNKRRYEWIDHGDHILAIENCFDDGLIESCIEVFDDCEEKGLTVDR